MRIEPMQIPRTNLPDTIQRRNETQSVTSSSGNGFSRQISDAIEQVNNLQHNANALTEKVASGEVEDTHKAVVAMEHALLALDFTLQVRNKMLDAYQEIMRTQM